MITLNPTVTVMTASYGAVTSVGAQYLISVLSDWKLGDWATVVFTEDISAVTVVVGYGDITGLTPSFLLTYKNKLYLICGDKFFFSDVGSPTVINDPNGTGNGFVETSNFTSENEDLVALASYQGRLAVFSRRNTQVWNVDALPENYTQIQLLQNVGTMAKLSVQSVGDLDVFFLSDSGVRSLRVRDSSLNAYVVDVGSPIDTLIQAALLSVTGENNEDACGIVEPTSNRYWLYLKGLIYVLSYFPSSKIIGWTTFTPVYETLTPMAATLDNFGGDDILHFTGLTVGSIYYWTKGNGVSLSQSGKVVLTNSGYFLSTAVTAETAGPIGTTGMFATSVLAVLGHTSFVPTEFLAFNGQVFCRTVDNKIVAYGGTDNNTYDHVQAIAELPWLALKTPGTNKRGQSVDIAGSGQWIVQAGMDPIGGALDQTSAIGSTVSPNAAIDSTFDKLALPFQGQGTHFKVRATTGSLCNFKCVLSSIVLHFEEDDEK